MPKYYITSKHSVARWLIDKLNIKEALNRYEFLEGQKMEVNDLCEYDVVMVSEIGFGLRECGEYGVTIKKEE